MAAERQRLVVVGGSLAGLRAAEAARRAGYAGPLTLIGAEDHLPYDRPPLSKEFLGAEPADAVTFRSESSLREELDVDLRLGSAATRLDTTGRVVHLSDGTELRYTGCVLATGAGARQPPIPGVGSLTGVHTLRTLDDAHRIRAALDAGACRIVVVGAGFIGSEIAATVRNRGLPVTVVEAAEVPLAGAVGEYMGAACARLHARHGTELRCGVTVTALEGENRVRRVRLSDGSTLDAELVVVGAGAVPTTGWLQDSGLTLDDGVVCDETLATGAPGVYAAGDVARWPNPLFEEAPPMRLEHWTTTAEQGKAAALAALDPAGARPFATVPYFWSDWYAHRLQFVGTPAADEVRLVDGDQDDEHFLALYRRGARVVGALGLDHRKQVMKLRALVGKRASWDDALAARR